MLGRQRRVVTTSWDDGNPLDSALGELLDLYGIAATFYVPLANREREVLSRAALTDLSTRFEVGGHTRSHVDLRGMHERGLEDEVRSAKLELEDALGKPVRMFCYPRGRYDRRVRSAVARSGYLDARTTRAFCRDLEWRPFEMPTSVQFFPHSASVHLRHEVTTGALSGVPRVMKTVWGRRWIDIAHFTFVEMLEKGGVWHLWGHSWEVEELGLWDELRRLLDRVAGRSDVEYLTNGELAESTAPSRARREPR